MIIEKGSDNIYEKNLKKMVPVRIYSSVAMQAEQYHTDRTEASQDSQVKIIIIIIITTTIMMMVMIIISTTM